MAAAVKLLVIEAMRKRVCSVDTSSGAEAHAPVSTNSSLATTPQAIEQ